MIQEKILELTEYGLVTGLVASEDKKIYYQSSVRTFSIR